MQSVSGFQGFRVSGFQGFRVSVSKKSATLELWNYETLKLETLNKAPEPITNQRVYKRPPP